MNETCDVCKIEFPSSTPNEAIADAKIKGLGLWGYVCKAHLSYADPKLTTMFDSMNRPVEA